MNMLRNCLRKPIRWALPLPLVIMIVISLRLLGRIQDHMSTVRATHRVGWTEIYRGVFLTTRHLPSSSEGGGMIYAIRVDLNQPGIDLYFRPPQIIDTAPLDGFYNLRYPWQTAASENLAVAVNANFFAPLDAHTDMPLVLRKLNWYGERAKEGRPTVINHKVDGSFFVAGWLWFEDDLTPHLERFARNRPRTDLTEARYAFTTDHLLILNSVAEPFKASSTAPIELHARTGIAIDPARRFFYIICFQRASDRLAAQQILDLGIPDAMMLDGGGSTCLTLGDETRNYQPGTILGGLRPVGAILGIRAQPLP